MASQVAPAQAINQSAHRGVLFKLIVFSVSLAVVPLSSYFLSEKYIWNGNSTYAALSAVFAANFVLIAYIVVSIRDDTTTEMAKVEREHVKAKQISKELPETKKDK